MSFSNIELELDIVAKYMIIQLRSVLLQFRSVFRQRTKSGIPGCFLTKLGVGVCFHVLCGMKVRSRRDERAKPFF